jgi:hypothetical protein
MVRTFTLADLVELESSAKFPLSNLRGKKVLTQGSAEYEGRLVGSFWVHETTELSLVLADKASRAEKMIALREIENRLEKEAEWFGIPEIHCFVNDPKFAQILSEHFRFEYCLGRSMVRRRNG